MTDPDGPVQNRVNPLCNAAEKEHRIGAGTLSTDHHLRLESTDEGQNQEEKSVSHCRLTSCLPEAFVSPSTRRSRGSLKVCESPQPETNKWAGDVSSGPGKSLVLCTLSSCSDDECIQANSSVIF